MRALHVNDLIKVNSYKSYLEIGVGKNFATYNLIDCEVKAGIDPFEDNEWYTFNQDKLPKGVFRSTSDEFFAKAKRAAFDCIFIDGLHERAQVEQDILNSLNILKPGGMIILDDVNPVSEEMQLVPRETRIWTGDVWRAWLRFRMVPELQMFTIDITRHGGPYGLGVIQKGKQIPLKGIDHVTVPYSEFTRSKSLWLNLQPPTAKKPCGTC